ncbi:hypothetical protein ASZ90_007870 [hydrocarbon metagenome]|uniref:Uncharacterized protein n=1 Tax=hydrocarbon metagenome TaxID=938273 RepID=A0A0W8FNA3_9ZZZZ
MDFSKCQDSSTASMVISALSTLDTGHPSFAFILPTPNNTILYA